MRCQCGVGGQWAVGTGLQTLLQFCGFEATHSPGSLSNTRTGGPRPGQTDRSVMTVTERSGQVICTCMTDDFNDRSVTAFLVVLFILLFVLFIVLANAYHFYIC